MSTTLTLTPHRRREPRRIRGIPTISAGHLDGGTANVSAVDTELPTGSNPRGLSGEAGRPHQGPSHLSPSDSCPALLVPAQPPGGGSTSALARPASGRPTPRGWGSTGRRLCVLHEPPPLVEYPQPSSSSTRTSCSRRPRPSAKGPPTGISCAGTEMACEASGERCARTETTKQIVKRRPNGLRRGDQTDCEETTKQSMKRSA